jgi:hypothetical protein
VRADVATPEGQAALFAACPEPYILINNKAGPPLRDFRELTRQQIGQKTGSRPAFAPGWYAHTFMNR